jgi:phenylacetate-coenzyme A ligase PaaK-like adenylate-forming protein
MSGGQTQKQVQLICDFKPDIIMVTLPDRSRSPKSSR